MERTKCEECVYFEPFPDDDRGRCRRNAPTVLSYPSSPQVQAGPARRMPDIYVPAGRGRLNAIWPQPKKDDWCAEWKAYP